MLYKIKPERDLSPGDAFVLPPGMLARYANCSADLELLEALGTDDVFCPDTATLYPNGYAFRVISDSLATVMEGRSRPGWDCASQSPRSGPGPAAIPWRSVRYYGWSWS